jgi:hypothetical protein
VNLEKVVPIFLNICKGNPKLGRNPTRNNRQLLEEEEEEEEEEK